MDFKGRGKTLVHQKASQKALEAAELSIKDSGVHATAAAAQFGVSRSSVTQGRTVLEFGTPQEIADAKSGKIGVRTLADRIRKTIPPKTKEELRKRVGKTLTANHLATLATDKMLWGKLGLVLRTLSELPHPKELIPVVKGNNSRKQTVNLFLRNATNWIEEFNHEWERSQEGASDTGKSSQIT